MDYELKVILCYNRVDFMFFLQVRKGEKNILYYFWKVVCVMSIDILFSFNLS